VPHDDLIVKMSFGNTTSRLQYAQTARVAHILAAAILPTNCESPPEESRLVRSVLAHKKPVTTNAATGDFLSRQTKVWQLH
jgi:hypothetical protein